MTREQLSSLKIGDKVRYGNGSTVFEVANPNGPLDYVGIYDEPPSKRVDYIQAENLEIVEETEDKPGDGEEYEFITAEVDCGSLSWKYKVKGVQVPGRMNHDEDVSDWSDEDIVNLTMSMLEVPEHQRGLVKLTYG